MVKKYKLYEIGNEGNFNHYLFDKKQEIIEELFKIFLGTLGVEFPIYYTNKNKKQVKINFNKIKDSHEAMSGIYDNVGIDLFYGDKKLFITIHCSQKLRIKFNESLFEVFFMPEYKHPKNVKKLKVKLKDKYQTIGPFEPS